MGKSLSALIVLSLVLAYSLPAQNTLIGYGSNWSYYDAGNAPSSQGPLEWYDNAYDVSTWNTGNAHLGYGDGDEVTVVSSGIYACYVRHTFQVADPSIYSGLDLSLTYDDGAVVYLNGVEVWRVNMPGGAITYNTFAASTSSENAMTALSIANMLMTGDNVLAVEIHQASASSSDISFDFRLNAAITGQVNVIRGPYLQSGTPNSVHLRWRTDGGTESVVQYGTSPGNLNLSASELTIKTEHDLLIQGLDPGTVYYYQVSNANDVLVPGSTDLYFKTHPTPGNGGPVRAWVLGDCGTQNANQRAVRDAYYAYVGQQHTDMILFLGDNAYNDGTDAEYQFAVFENMYEDKLRNSIAWSCLGNHDGHSANSNTQTGPYYDIFTFPKNGESGGVASGTEAYYSYDYGNLHFIILDSYETDRAVGGTMYNWAQNDIQNTSAEWIIAFWHHPPYSKGSHDSDTETALIQMRENFLPMLEANGVDLVLSGHSHSYERSYLLNGHYGTSGTFNINTHTVGATGSGDGQADGDGAYEKSTSGPNADLGAVYVTAGSSGQASGGSLDHNAMYYSVSALGSCIIETDGSTLNLKFIRENGTIQDYFTIEKSGGCTIGGPCDDGDACTDNDIYDSNCTCAGTFTDTDGDGVCDAEDQCPGQDDNLIGTSCDDGDICTVNDVYDNTCGCTGTFSDSDGDGICDAQDQCPGQDDNLIGTPCDDGDACTINDLYDNTCGCAGTFSDSDGDGVCDADDQCPGQDDSLIGTACDDGDACTINDLYDSNCGCTGTYADNDGDGFCIGIDPDDNDGCNPDPGSPACNPCAPISQESFESGFGIWIDGGSDCTLTTSNPNTGSYSVQLRDDSGPASSMWTQDMDMSGLTEVMIDFSFYAIGFEPGEDLLLEISTNGGSSYIIQESWINGPDFENDVRKNVSVLLSGITWGAQSRFRIRCDASGNDDRIYLDDVVITSCCTIGAPCNDGDDCTIGDIYQSDCICAGTFQDTDGDGVCDAEDQCPGQDDAMIGTSCNDGDPCTDNDLFQADCSCAGIYTDADGDGYCISDDPNDNDGCIPDPGSPACSPCQTYSDEDFEAGFGPWNNGGNDCQRVNANANSGSFSIRLRDDSGEASSIYTNNLDLSAEGDVDVSFSFYPTNMEPNEDFFLEISTNGGSSYFIYADWISGVDFQNDTRYDVTLTITGITWSAQSRFRLRCDASANDDQVYFDDVVIESCSGGAAFARPSSQPAAVFNGGREHMATEDQEISLLPNPVNHAFMIIGMDVQSGEVEIFNSAGMRMPYQQMDGGRFDVSDLPSGIYFVRIVRGDQMIVRRFVKSGAF